MTPALPRQHANIARGLCRYGADHPRPAPGRHVCSQCQEDRAADDGTRRKKAARIYGACARQTMKGPIHPSPIGGNSHCEECLAKAAERKPSKGMRLCKACGGRGHFAKTCRRRALMSGATVAT